MLQSQASGQAVSVLRDIAEDDEGVQGSQFWKRLILDALHEGRVALLYQSVMSVKDAKQMQIEVIGRLKNSAGEMIPAGQFIPMANRHQLTPALDLAILRKLIYTLKKNPARAEQVAINLSIHSIQDATFLEWLMQTLRDASIAKRLVFEFTEFGVAQNREGIERFVA